MILKKKILKNSLITYFIFIFIVFYFLFLSSLYIVPNNYFNISPILLIGFATVIIGVFLFFILMTNNDNNVSFNFKLLSEDSIKIILIIFMCISFFIPPISSTKTIIDWHLVNIFNYFRGFSFLLGCAFLPGSNLYKIFFSKNSLHERFKVEPFIIKITLYPLLSFIFIGISVLILDQIGLFIRELFSVFLFLLILILFFSDLIIQKIRKENLKLDSVKINISKGTAIILIVALGILLISLGIHFQHKYLIRGDSYVGLSPAMYIGKLDITPMEYGKNISYPIFWGYIIFGLSVLSGLPYINLNAILAPFCYLLVTTLYLLFKAVLNHSKEKYIVLSTILASIFSGLFYIPSDLGSISNMTFSTQFYFIFKSFSFCLLFFAIAIFIIITTNYEGAQKKKIYKTEIFKFLNLTSLFLIISFMLYMFPLIIGISFIFLYCLFSDKKKKFFRYLSIFSLLNLVYFFIFDIVSEFFLSYLFAFKVFDTFGILISLNEIEFVIFTYLILFLIFFF